jgi:hypothetical protein
MNPDHFSFRARLICYLALWLFAAAAFEIMLSPLGATETAESPLHQRLTLPLYTPILAVAGLGLAFTWPDDKPHWVFWSAAAFYLAAASLLFSSGRPRYFVPALVVTAIALGVSVFYFVRFTALPGDG